MGFDLRTRANTLPSLSKALAKQWPRGLPPRMLFVRGPGGTSILIKGGTDGNIADARWGGLKATWSDAWKLPTWTAELQCGYRMARNGASSTAIKKSCKRR